MLARLYSLFASALIARAMRTPYSHLYHPDGSLYMERYWLVPFVRTGPSLPGCGPVSLWRRPLAWLFQRFEIAVRVHHLATEDQDPHMHDHPWDFWSLMLRGWYIEMRPLDNTRPCFMVGEDTEEFRATMRRAGSFARRAATDRHRIYQVSDEAWTLFITFRKRQWWGFYMPHGKVYWRNYESCYHQAKTEA